MDSVVGPSVICEPKVKIKNNVTIKAFSHLAGCQIASGCEVGPFARLRSGTILHEDVELGSFVVTKKAEIGKKSKAKQLNCLVDCTIGEGVNIGGGAIFANYHHFRKEKHTVEIGDGASIGALSTLVAPVKVGTHAFVGAGTVVRKDVPDEALAVSQSDVVIKAGYGKK
jgi:bifunctional UDP-N-acetylglucosamine pyrophosphorylase/glucosamine-1-phosphate N-acetyltransferase